MRTDWDISGDCRQGFERSLYGAPAPPLGQTKIDVAPGTSHPLELCLTTRCRECDKCRIARARMWRERARIETERSSRTWFGTLTLTPEMQMHFLNVARRKSDASCGDIDGLAEPEKFRRHVEAIGEELTLFLKRVRKNSGARLRYMLVAEQHKSGMPHFHALIHELSQPIRHRTLKDAWRCGFTDFKLVNQAPAAAAYVAKYLVKSAMVRVRASARYGSTEMYEPISTTLEYLTDFAAFAGGPAMRGEQIERSEEIAQRDFLSATPEEKSEKETN